MDAAGEKNVQYPDLEPLDYATHPAEGTPLLEQYATGLAAPLTWIDVAGYCSGRFAEGTLRDAQTKQWMAFLADKFGQSAPEVTPARLDGVTSANVDRSVLDGRGRGSRRIRYRGLGRTRTDRWGYVGVERYA